MLHLTDLPTPDPAPGEVLVRLTHSGVNPSDVKARAGSRPGVVKPPFDVIVPHSDGAGVIEAVGAGVESARNRAAGLDLERAMAAALWHRGRDDRPAVGAGRGAARRDEE